MENEFEDIIYGDSIDLEKEDVEYEGDTERDDILLEFLTAPYEGLMDKIRNHVSVEKTDTKQTFLIMKYKDTEDAWELGYINMGLEFWKMVEDIFINYKPKFYRVKEESLKELNKIDFIKTVKFEGSELDGYVE